MPKRKQIDNKKLISMVAEGTPQIEIMDAFGFKTSSQLKIAYGNALMETGQVPTIDTSRAKTTASAKVDRNVAVNNRGSLIIPKGLVEELGLSVGDCYRVKTRKNDISLKRVSAAANPGVQAVVEEKLKVIRRKKG